MAKLKYHITAGSADEAIDVKNKILINTTDKEEVEMEISINSHYYKS